VSEPGLDPRNLTPIASINRVRIVDLPGVALDEDVRGRLAFDLLGLDALAVMVRARPADLRLSDNDARDPRNLPLLLSRRLESPDAAVRDSAREVAARFGRRLGYLLLTLKRGDPVNRQARPDWDGSYWSHWSGIRDVWLGGGLASGALGEEIRSAAVRVLRDGEADCSLHLSPLGALLPLVGAARRLEASALPALVSDFGQSQVKLGVAHYREASLSLLEVPPAIPTSTLLAAGGQHELDLAGTAENMVRLLGHHWSEQTARVGGLRGEIVVSVASYVRSNHPIPREGGGIYQEMASFTDGFGEWMSGRLTVQAGNRLEVRLMHDGTAAAFNYAASDRTAVILLGTALGVGFAASDETSLALASDFKLRGL
jgi:hypothetical protein